MIAMAATLPTKMRAVQWFTLSRGIENSLSVNSSVSLPKGATSLPTNTSLVSCPSHAISWRHQKAGASCVRASIKQARVLLTLPPYYHYCIPCKVSLTDSSIGESILRNFESCRHKVGRNCPLLPFQARHAWFRLLRHHCQLNY